MDGFPIGSLIGVIIISKNVNKLKRTNRYVPWESLLKIDFKAAELEFSVPTERAVELNTLYRGDHHFGNHF